MKGEYSMLKSWFFNVVGKCAHWAFDYSNAKFCYWVVYQEELPQEALEANKEV